MIAARQAAWRGHLLTGLVTLVLLYGVLRVHAAGESLLALTLLVVAGMTLWTYTSRRSHALRYLLPGVAAAMVFVIFPMLYTISIGFTNYSSANLLDHERARAYLLEESPDFFIRINEMCGPAEEARRADVATGPDVAGTAELPENDIRAGRARRVNEFRRCIFRVVGSRLSLQ